MKCRVLFPAVALAIFTLTSANQASGFELLDRMLGRHHGGCCDSCCEPSCCEPTCCEAEPTCCEAEPACCEAEPACCEAPSCCEPCCKKRCRPLRAFCAWLHRCCHRDCCDTCCEPSCCEAEPVCGCGN